MNRISLTMARPILAVVTIAVIVVVAWPTWAPSHAQSATPIDLFVTTFFEVKTADECMARVQSGFKKAGYADITVDPTTGVRGVMTSGDNAGITSMATCFTSSAFVLALTSAGRSSLGEAGPQAQNSRLLKAIND